MRTLLAFLLLCTSAFAQPPLVITGDYKLTEDLRFAGSGIILNGSLTLDLNGHTFSYGADNKSGTPDKPGSVGIASGSTHKVTIKNGKIIHAGNGDACHGIYSRGNPHFSVENVEVVVNGKDSHTVYNYWSTATLKNCVLRSNSTGSFNRHSGPANVRAGGKCIATGNVLIGGNSGFNVGDGSEIKGNVIAHDSHVTNGYGVWLYSKDDVQIHDNLILPSNGRGVLLQGNRVEVLRNVILFLDAPNKEYEDALNACAIRARYNVRDNVVADNIGLGIAGTNLTGCSGLYLTNQSDGRNRYERNHLTTIVRGEPSIQKKKYAKALAMEGHNINHPDVDVIEKNTFRSNHLLVATGGFDGVCGSQTIKDSDFWYVDGPAANKDFLVSVDAKLKEIGLQENPAAKEVLVARTAQITALLKDEPVRPEKAFWFTKYWTGDEKCVIEGSRFHNTDPAAYTTYAPFYQGSVHLEAKDIVRITKAPEKNSEIVVTPIEPQPDPDPDDPRDQRIKELEQALASEREARQHSDKLAEELQAALMQEQALSAKQRERIEAAIKALTEGR